MVITMRLLLECSKASVLALVAFIAGCYILKTTGNGHNNEIAARVF